MRGKRISAASKTSFVFAADSSAPLSTSRRYESCCSCERCLPDLDFSFSILIKLSGSTSKDPGCRTSLHTSLFRTTCYRVCNHSQSALLPRLHFQSPQIWQERGGKDFRNGLPFPTYSTMSPSSPHTSSPKVLAQQARSGPIPSAQGFG
jgi:hypothetical protein